jgi:ABC-type Mn2+/Zn2+ transport system ATPase subunit
MNVNKQTGSQGSTSCLRAQHLDIGYNHDTVVADINIELQMGQSLALVGTNGSGKSTLLKTIVGLQPPIRGNLTTFERKPGSVPRHVAYLSQFHVCGFVLPLRAVDVVRMGRFPILGLLGRMSREDEELVRAAMQTMGIEKLADSPLWSLSGGQQQRTYIAQVLAHRADLLVLDEPTAGLDAAGRDVFSRAIKAELARSATVVVATHDIEEASACDMLMLLARRVVAVGAGPDVLTPDLLLKTFGIQIPHH